MAATNFSMDDITLEYSQEDYKPQSREPKLGLMFEWKVATAKVKQADAGHLQVVLEVHALDGDGKKMFQKYINIPMPVSIGENTAPDYAKFMWLNSVRPLFPEHAPFDKVEKDAITGKNVFYKNGEVVKGKAYEDAVTAANMAIGSLAKDVAREWVESGDNTPVAAFVDKCFFAKLKASKDAKYVNVDRMYTEAPEGEEVCYDRTVALPR